MNHFRDIPDIRRDQQFWDAARRAFDAWTQAQRPRGHTELVTKIPTTARAVTVLAITTIPNDQSHP